MKHFAEAWVLDESASWHCDMLHSEMSDLIVSIRCLISTIAQRNLTTFGLQYKIFLKLLKLSVNGIVHY